MPKTVIQIEKLSDNSSAKEICDAVSRVRGVRRVNLRVNSSKLLADYNADETSPHAIKEMIESFGYRVIRVSK